jgi:hypothetical protein
MAPLGADTLLALQTPTDFSAFNTSQLPQTDADPLPTPLTITFTNCAQGSVGTCRSFYREYSPEALYDLFDHPTAGPLVLFNYEPSDPSFWSMPYVALANFSANPIEFAPVVDMRISAPFAFDGALFFRDRSYCNGRGNFVENRECICDSVSFYGRRCELQVPAPVRPPVAPPTASPANSLGVAPVSTPASPAGAPTGTTAAPKAAQPVSGASSFSVPLAVSILLSVVLYF